MSSHYLEALPIAEVVGMLYHYFEHHGLDKWLLLMSYDILYIHSTNSL